MKIIDYLKENQTIGLGVVIGAFTYEMIEGVKSNTLDPLFDSIVDPKTFRFNIKVGKNNLKIGQVIYELFKWLCYCSLVFMIHQIYKSGIQKAIQNNVWTVFVPVSVVLILKVVKNNSSLLQKKSEDKEESV